MLLRRKNPAIAVERPATSHANALLLAELELEVQAGDTEAVAEGEAKNAINAVKLVILHATAPREEDTVEGSAAEGAMVEATAELTAAVDVEVANRPATLVAVMDTCPVIALKVKSATTVSSQQFSGSLCLQSLISRLGGEVGHLSRDCPSETTSERTCYKCKKPGHVQAQCPN